jgi:hypothetical protein
MSIYFEENLLTQHKTCCVVFLWESVIFAELKDK